MAACQPLPHANGPTVSEYYGLIRLPEGLRLPYYFSIRLRLPAHGPVVDKDPMHLPTSGTPRASQVPGVSLHTCHALCRPRQALGELTNLRSLCVGFPGLARKGWYRYTIATCFMLGNEAVSPVLAALVQARLQGVSQIPRSPAGRFPLRPMWFPVYASAVSFGYKPPPQLRQSRHGATLGMGGWLGLTQLGLPPCKKTPSFLGAQRLRAVEHPSDLGGERPGKATREVQVC